jgi:hypothetical protein
MADKMIDKNDGDKPLRKEFANPGALYRGKPFWSWNGKLEKNELLHQISVMKEMGFGGYFMHSRTGLETEYLGEEWFNLINQCADEGERLGMESWLYDEDRWPSGTAGGMVTEEPEFRMHFLHLSVQDVRHFSFENDEKNLAFFAAELNGIDLDEYQRIDEKTPLSKGETRKILRFSVKEMSSSTFYNGNTYVDTMNRKATDRFLELTHERYRDRCGQRLGGSIKGIFTDEPHRGQLMSDFGSEEVQGGEKIWSVPWTTALPEEFHKRFGYNLIERLPELFLTLKGESVSQVKWHFTELLQQLFLENFAIPNQEWCRQNGLLFTGHVLHEDSLTAQTAMSGSMLRFYEHMDYPGIDILSEGNKHYWVAKQVQSAARQTGRKWILSELYGCTGWQMDFESHKNVGDWQALFGVNLRCHHLSWYTMKCQAKRDYPASILHQSTWWKEYAHVEDYFSRINLFMTQGDPVCSTLVLNPVESVWSQVYPGWCHGLTAADKRIIALEERYQDVFHLLMGAHIDFDYGDEEMLSRLGRVEIDKMGHAVLWLGEAPYKQVLLTGMTTVRDTTLNLLEKFIAAGGHVVLAGDIPIYVNALPSNRARILGASILPWEAEKVISALTERVKRKIRITNDKGEVSTGVYLQARENDDALLCMALNMNREEPASDLTISLNMEDKTKSGLVERWFPETGESIILGNMANGFFSQKMTLPPGGELLLMFKKKNSPETATPMKEEDHGAEEITLTTENLFSYHLDEPNICVLDWAAYRLNSEPWQSATEILRVDKTLRDRTGLPHRSGQMLQPWFVAQGQTQPRGTVSLCFEFDVMEIPKEMIFLVLEDSDRFTAELNGKSVELSHRGNRWIDICFHKIPLDRNLLKEGRNSLILTTLLDEKTNLEAVYLLGKFGVELTGNCKKLTPLPKQLKPGDISGQGLPFYSGRIEYYIPVNLPQEAKKGEKSIRISPVKGSSACVRVSLGDKSRLLAWAPFEAELPWPTGESARLTLEYILTRRNTFGPLHLNPPLTASYGPPTFETVGHRFTEKYSLLEQGMIKTPKITMIKKETSCNKKQGSHP